MRKIAEIIIGVFGIYFLILAINELASRSWSISSDAGLREYLMMYGSFLIFSLAGIIFILLRNYISGWILKWQDYDLPEKIDINRVECIILSTIGIWILFQTIPLFIMTVNNFIISPSIQQTEYGDLPLKSYAFVQAIATGFEMLLALALLLIPGKIQSVLNRIRGF